MKYDQLLQENSDKIMRLYWERTPTRQVAEKIGIPYNTIVRFYKTHNLSPIRKPTKKKPSQTEVYQQIIKFYLSNHTLQQTGDEFGLTRERVRQILNLHKIKPRYHTCAATVDLPKSPMTSIERFWFYVDKSAGKNGCWIWKGSQGAYGYGRVSFNGEHFGAHRLSFFLTHKRRPTLHVLHSCDNPSCVNPAHLRKGTHKDNMRDKVERGRCNPPRLFSSEQVIEIRRLLAQKRTLKEISTQFGCSTSVIFTLKIGKTYREEIFFENK